MDNYVVTHLHSMLSNATTNIDSVTSFEAYVDKAKELGMKAIAFTEHGNILSWKNKKDYCEKNGIKYIHAVEAYLTANNDLTTEKVRDNYHVCLYALNYQGFLELNKLISNAGNRKTNHFYFTPRIYFDEFLRISDNIAVTSACLGGVLNRGTEELKKKFLQYFVSHDNRCFLEIQHHNVKDQIEYNQYLYKLSQQYKLKLITGTDTHSLDQLAAEGREKLQKAKKIFFDNEVGWDLTFKNYKELVSAYEEQKSLPMDVVLAAIDNTNKLADMVEEYDIDSSPKYPVLYNNPDDVFEQKIQQGFQDRNIPKEKLDIYKQRASDEVKVFKKTGSINYMLFMKDLVDYAHQNNMWQGYGRGSVNGSIVAYLLGITDMDSIKYKLNFFRFMNPDRISLADIDTDWSNEDRDKIKEYLFNLKGLYASEIITFNTIALKGAIRDIGRALNMSLEEVGAICSAVYINDQKQFTIDDEWRKKYPELFKYVDIVNGVVVSVGSHPSGVLVSPIPIDTNVGTCMLSTNDHPVSQLNMKELDHLNFVKFDILGLDNIDVINRTCKLANIERKNPDNTDFEDKKVWNSIRDNTTTIFQWESSLGQHYLKQLFSDQTIKKLKAQNINTSYIELLAFGNGAIRPSGESFRDKAARGIINDNGLSELNTFLSDTLGYLLYQEQIMMFLVKFCGYSMSESDSVRRAIGKKLGTEDLIPEIEKRFIDTSTKQYHLSNKKAEEIVKPFIQVILNASSYGFSLNHSLPYSMIGYVCGWLREYYPLEYLTSCLNVFQDKEEKTQNIIEYCKTKGIQIKPIKFRYSKSDYFYDKKTNCIYKGIASIKYCNDNISEELYNLRNQCFNTFTDFLVYATENLRINSRQLDILIKLNFFSEFGKNKKLSMLYQQFIDGKNKYKKTYCEKTKVKRIAELKEIESKIPDEIIPMKLQLLFEQEILGSPVSTYLVHKGQGWVMELDTKYSPKLKIYGLINSVVMEAKIDKKTFKKKPLTKGCIVQILKYRVKPKMRKTENGFETVPNTKEFWLTDYEIIGY